MAPIIQYAVVCHMESRRPQKTYKNRWVVYPLWEISIFDEFGGMDWRVYVLIHSFRRIHIVLISTHR
jgi:hypothetical protein